MSNKQNNKKNSAEKPEQKPQKISKEETEELEEIRLWTHPLTTLYYFSCLVAINIKKVLAFILSNIVVFIILCLVLIVPHFIQGPHSAFYKQGEEIGYFCLYWIILGVASSIGLGTGLHTFVLYLGPRIANITMRAYQCNSLPVMLPSRWNYEYFDKCPDQVDKPVEFLDILLSVQIEAFLWGFGTALGELPPYFIAKAAAESKKRIEELEDVETHKDGKDFMSIAKRLIYNNLQKYGFITVLLCASIPNPLFDLAGITCGHFGIPFMTFFLATAIGKSIIKVHLQMLFVIFTFSKNHVDSVLIFLESHLPFLKNSLSEMLKKQQQALAERSVSDEKPLIAQLWDYFIFLMIGYFLVSIINSLAQGHYHDLKEEEKEKKNKKKD